MLGVNPLSDYRFKYVNGLELTILGDESVQIAPGRCRDADDTFQMESPNAITVFNTHVGVNGLDQGAVANNTLYGIYLITDQQNANAPAGLLSTNLTTPLMPYGYNSYRLIGFVRTDGTADFLAGKFYGHGSERVFMYDTALATAVTVGAAVTYTAVSLANAVPAQDGLPVIFRIDATPSAAGRSVSLQPYGATGDGVTLNGQVATVHVIDNVECLAGLNAGVPTVNYTWSAGGGDAVAISVAGYRYSL